MLYVSKNDKLLLNDQNDVAVLDKQNAWTMKYIIIIIIISIYLYRITNSARLFFN